MEKAKVYFTRDISAEGLKKIPRLFYGVDFPAGTTIELPSSVTEIEEGAFAWSTGLTGVVFKGDAINKIGNKAFYECSDLADFEFPNSLEVLGNEAFKHQKQETFISQTNTAYQSKKGGDNP